MENTSNPATPRFVHSLPLHLGNLAQSSECRAHGSSGGRSDGVGTSAVVKSVVTSSTRIAGFDLRNSALAGLAVPDANRVTLDAGLAAESAHVLGVLGDFHLLDRLSEGGTVSLRKSGQFQSNVKAKSRSNRDRSLSPGFVSSSRGLFVPSTVLAGHCEMLSVPCRSK